MKITVGEYENLKINRDNGKWWSRDTSLIKPGELGGLGGVDHYRCRSIKTIVRRYIQRLQRDDYYGYPGAVHNIVIILGIGICSRSNAKTITIPIICE